MGNERGGGSEPLTSLLEESFRSPRSIPLQGPLRRCGVLALCLHCLMVKAGFRTAEDRSTKPRFSWIGGIFRRKSMYTPPPSWLCLLPSTEFIFRYTYPGKEGVFLLHCSLQEATQRLFVQVSENGGRENAQVLGLQVDRSVPDSEQFREATKKGTWRGVVRHQDSVINMFQMYVTDPLLRKAQPSINGGLSAGNRNWFNPTTDQVWIGLGLVAVLFVVISRARS